jgi:anti-sigma regulatory factor (Ser/Thr protein kinase)
VEALLIDQWLGGLEPVFVRDEASLTVVRDHIKEVADRAVLVASEIGRNHLRHARDGRVAVRTIQRGEHRGLELVAVDRGRGIADIAAAMDALPRAEGTLGVGVGAIRRLSSEVDFDVRVGEGTRIVARFLDREAPRRREVGIYGRPIASETVSGDHACFCRIDETTLVLGVCDGLGHGPFAREAASAAMHVFHERAREAPARILEVCHGALGNTRGVVMAVTRVAEDAATLETSSVGNIDLQLCSPRSARRLGGISAVVGGSSRLPTKPRSETAALAKGELIILATDGIGSKMSIEQDLELLRTHPVVVAQRIVERFGRAHDDALVLVAR